MHGGDAGFITTRLDELLGWARKFSLFQYPFVTACCGMEFMAVAGPRYDVARFGAEAPRFSPRQSDLLWIVGTISQRQAPVLRRIYEQMGDPKYVLAFGTCASVGGFYDNYATLPGADKVIPVDVYVPGCPPRPEAVLDGLMLLMDKVGKGPNAPPEVLLAPPKSLPQMAQIRKKGTAVDFAHAKQEEERRLTRGEAPSLGELAKKALAERPAESVSVYSRGGGHGPDDEH